MALNDDGSVLAIGSANSSPLGSTDGRFDVVSIYEYDVDQNNLIQQGESIFKVDNGDGQLSASKVPLSGDGQVAIVTHKGSRNSVGLGYAQRYEYNGTDWLPFGGTLFGNALKDSFGASLAIASDATTLAVGAYDDVQDFPAYVQIWDWNSTEVEWIQRGQDLESSRNGDRFGFAVDLSKDGSVLVVGAPNRKIIDVDDQQSGYVQVFQWDGLQWNSKGGTITLEDEAYNRLGESVSISDDGNSLAIGVPSQDSTTSGVDSGLVQSWQWNGLDWIPRGFSLRGDYANGQFGESVVLSGDARTLVVGVPGLGGMNSPLSGKVRAFD